MSSSLRTHVLVAFFAGTLAFTLGGACKDSHASSEDIWKLQRSKAGSKPRGSLAYEFDPGSWGRRKLVIESEARGVTVEDQASLTFDIIPKRAPGDRNVLELNLVDVVRGKTPTGPGWDRPERIYWMMDARGRTRRLSVEDIKPRYQQGLPDLHLLLRRLAPVMPSEPVGEGAEWRLRRKIRLPVARRSGSGYTAAVETIVYRLVDMTNGPAGKIASIEAKGTVAYSGSMEAVGRMVKINGEGSYEVKAAFQVGNGTLRSSTLRSEERLELILEGRSRKTSVTTKARLIREPTAESE
jgi:hypothetical protein